MSNAFVDKYSPLHPAAIRGESSVATFGTAAFATPEEIRRSLSPRAGRDATPVLGYYVDEASGSDKLCPIHPPPGNVLINASSGAGKTSGPIETAALTHSGPSIFIDGKGQAYHHTAGARQKYMGRNAVLLTTDGPTQVFNPLLTVRIDHSNPKGGRYEARDCMAIAHISAHGYTGDNRFFENASVKAVGGVIGHVLTAELASDSGSFKDDPEVTLPRERSPAEVSRLLTLDHNGRRLLAQRMQKSGRHFIRQAGSMLADASIGDGKLAMNIAMFGSENWSIFESHEVRAMTYKAASPGPKSEPAPNDVDFTTFRDGRDDVYVVFPLMETARYAPVLRMFVGTMLDVLSRDSGSAESPFVTMHIDEFPQLKTLDPVQDWIMFLRGARISPWFYVQDSASLRRHYPDSWATFEANATKVFFGINDICTAEHLSKYLGMATVSNRTYSLTGGQGGGKSYTWQTSSGVYGTDSKGETTSENWFGSSTETVAYTGRPLKTPDEILRMGRHEMIILVRGMKPIQAYLIPYYDFPELKRMSETPPPHVLPFSKFLD